MFSGPADIVDSDCKLASAQHAAVFIQEFHTMQDRHPGCSLLLCTMLGSEPHRDHALIMKLGLAGYAIQNSMQAPEETADVVL